GVYAESVQEVRLRIVRHDRSQKSDAFNAVLVACLDDAFEIRNVPNNDWKLAFDIANECVVVAGLEHDGFMAGHEQVARHPRTIDPQPTSYEHARHYPTVAPSN